MNKIFSKDLILRVIAIVGLLGVILSLYVKYFPQVMQYYSFQEEHIKKLKSDQLRLEGVESLNNEILSLIDNNQVLDGVFEDSVVYISIPSENNDCSDLGLPSLPLGWGYRCAKKEDYQKSDGKGWVPVVFNKDFLLPIDPVNSVDNLLYYAFIANANKQYVLTSSLETIDYQPITKEDRGNDDTRFEIGNYLYFWSKAQGLLLYLPLTRDDYFMTPDFSGNNMNAKIYDVVLVDKGNRNKLFYFDGYSSSVALPHEDIFDCADAITISGWISLDSDFKANPRWISKGNTHVMQTGFMAGYWNSALRFVIGNSEKYIELSTRQFSLSEEHYFVATFDSSTSKVKLYVDGELKAGDYLSGKIGINNKSLNIGMLTNGDRWKGSIREVKIYSRALTDGEVKKNYDSFLRH